MTEVGSFGWRLASPLGVVDITVVDTGVRRLTVGVEGFAWDGTAMPLLKVPDHTPRIVDELSRQIAEYFAGDRREFDVHVDLESTTLSQFQRHVLLTLRSDVPYGETVTYGELAAMAGRPGAARAVGTAMSRNPVQLLIPCHRVVAVDGIGGYGGGPAGVALKRALLDRERPGWPTD